ncbi:MAG: HEAT repeat domain-containing protein [Anaerolineales bacterium]
MNEQQKQTTQVWKTLEEEQKTPSEQELVELSGLMDEDLERLKRAWSELSTEERRKLVERLSHMAEADIQMDFGALFRLGMVDPDAEVRATSIEALWEDEDVRLVPELIQALTQDEEEVVRVAAAQSLAHFVLLGELQKIRPRPFEASCEALITVYRNLEASLEERRRALESLAYAGRKEIPPAIEEAYEHPEERMRISAVFAMGRSADPRWKETAVRELRNPNPEMRFEAARACGELEAREAVPDLIDLAEDVDIEVQEMALWALGQIGGQVARRTLESYTESENEALRVAAETALQELEFFHGDLDHFFGPPQSFDGETELLWSETEEYDDEDRYDYDDTDDDFDDEDAAW